MSWDVIVLILLACAAFVTLFSAYLFDVPRAIASRRRCVAHRGESAAILAAPDDHLCDECRDRLERIRVLEWQVDAPLPPPSSARPSYSGIGYVNIQTANELRAVAHIPEPEGFTR